MGLPRTIDLGVETFNSSKKQYKEGVLCISISRQMPIKPDGRERMSELVTIQRASKMYGVPAHSFRQWGKNGSIPVIRLPGSKIRRFRLSDLDAFFAGATREATIRQTPEELGLPPIAVKNVIYCRVSSNHQRDDLERQIHALASRYPNHVVVKDIASGINFKRKGLNSILELAMQRELGELVVAHKDRLARFGFELIESIIRKGGGTITIADGDKEETKSEAQELAEDLLAITHVFACKQMGRRRYRTKAEKSENPTLSNEDTEENSQTVA